MMTHLISPDSRRNRDCDYWLFHLLFQIEFLTHYLSKIEIITIFAIFLSPDSFSFHKNLHIILKMYSSFSSSSSTLHFSSSFL